MIDAELQEGREATYEERATWGTCPVCHAGPGQWCEPAGTPCLGLKASGNRIQAGDGAHLARLQNAPKRIKITKA